MQPAYTLSASRMRIHIQPVLRPACGFTCLPILVRLDGALSISGYRLGIKPRSREEGWRFWHDRFASNVQFPDGPSDDLFTANAFEGWVEDALASSAPSLYASVIPRRGIDYRPPTWLGGKLEIPIPFLHLARLQGRKSRNVVLGDIDCGSFLIRDLPLWQNGKPAIGDSILDATLRGHIEAHVSQRLRRFSHLAETNKSVPDKQIILAQTA